ncbi:MAG TPA: hypothetical protein VGI03_07065 [Verrucomicrobiae bacterium]|jgi:chromosome segregation ATPase
MKIKTTTSQAEELKQQRALLESALNTVVRGNKKMEKLLNQQTTLSAEIQETEAAGPDDKRAITELTEKRTQLELVSRRLNELPSIDLYAEQKLKNALHTVTKLAHSLLNPAYEAHIGEIAKALMPYSSSESWARKLANDTDAAKSLAGAMFWDYGRWGNPVTSANNLLERIDQILSGEFVWQFTPNTQK